MEYRVNRKNGDKISMLGFGTSYIHEAGEQAAIAAIRRAYDGGVNYFDLAAAHKNAFRFFGEALRDVRNKVMYQIHFGADYSAGEYGWSTNGEVIRRNIGEVLSNLGTDYIDYGFIHCIDEISDWENYKAGGGLDYLMELKKQGVVHHIGLSSHTPATIMKVLDEMDVDMLMFSINPGYDYQKGDYAKGSVEERALVYRRCEAEGIGISVMKPFSGGQMLDASVSPFGKAMTPYQCMQYALDKPGVLTVLPGMVNVAQVEHLLGFFTASDMEKDYSVIASFSPADAIGKCVYCNHCKPCPVGIDIGLVNKYYDLSVNGDMMAAEHYKGLSLHASDCIVCGHCDKRCPFRVQQSARMKEIAEYFKM